MRVPSSDTDSAVEEEDALCGFDVLVERVPSDAVVPDTRARIDPVK